MSPAGGHRRRSVRKSRELIVATFNAHVLNGHYARLGVRELARRAGVARSTFYEHFDDKTSLLVESLYPLLSVIADAACGATAVTLPAVLQHLRDQRSNALALLRSIPERPAIEAGLTQLIAAGLASRERMRLPRTDAAAMLARTAFGLIDDWLARERAVSCENLAEIMRDVLHACRSAITG